jgi:hypothetical protein
MDFRRTLESTTLRSFGPLSSQTVLWTRAAPFDPGESDGSTRCVTADAGFIQSDGLATLKRVTRLIRVHLALRLMSSPRRGFVQGITPTDARRATCLTSHWHGKLLSVYEISLVS